MTAKPPRTGTPPSHHKTEHPPTKRSTLRTQMRAKRRALDTAAQRAAAERLVRIFGHCPLFRRSRHIAFYFANDGELDITPLLQRAWDMGKVCYLPLITPGKSLWFAPYADGDPLALNRFGIPEPIRPGLGLVSARLLDVILAPLVAFDDKGHRLGMGGGFYDRTLSFLRHRHAWRKPRVIGVAHDLQRVATLSAEPWDAPLDGVATDRRLYLFNNTRP